MLQINLPFPTSPEHHLSLRLRQHSPNLQSVFFSNLIHVPPDGKANLAKHTSDYVTSMVKTFQQLLTKFKVKFRLLMMDYKALGDLAPANPFTVTDCPSPPSSWGCSHPNSSSSWSMSQGLTLASSPPEDLFPHMDNLLSSSLHLHLLFLFSITLIYTSVHWNYFKFICNQFNKQVCNKEALNKQKV